MLKELVEIYRVKKANAYHKEGSFHTTKPKEHHSEKVKASFAKQRKELAELRSEQRLAKQGTPSTSIPQNKNKKPSIDKIKSELKELQQEITENEFQKAFSDNVTPKEIIKALTGLDNNDNLKFYDDGTVSGVDVNIYKAKAYNFERRFNLKNKEVSHDMLELYKSTQGGGAVKEMFKNAIPLYQKMGIEKITLDANLDAGGYAWAKYGFKLKNKNDAEKLSKQMNDKIEFGLIADYADSNPKAKKELETTKKILNKYKNSVELPRMISDIKTPEVDSFFSKQSPNARIKPSLAKYLLMNTEWKGELSLKDKASMDRLNKYINSGSIKKQDNQVSIKKQDAERQVVWGELYAPNRLDSDNEFMSRETLENLQMTIAKSGFKLPVDLDHKNVSQKDAHIVECFIARKGDPDFIEGSLVVGLHIPNQSLWNEVKNGRYNGFSIEALVNKKDREVEIEVPDIINGETKENAGHTHGFTTNLDVVNGKIVFKSGETLPCKTDGHVHKIQRWSATEFVNGHNHKLSISDYLKIKE